MKTILLFVSIGMLAFAGHRAQAAAPANDNFLNAINLAGDSSSLSGNNNIDATFEAGEPVCVYPETTNTVWFKYTPSADGAWTISTTGSVDATGAPWDAVVAVYTGSALTSLTKVVEQDTGLDETLTISVTAGATYYYQAGGFPDSATSIPAAAQDIMLTWNLQPPVVVDISNETTPWEPDLPAEGVNINKVVGAGNIAHLVGPTKTHWSSEGFTGIAIQLNGFPLEVNSGGGNEPFRAFGPISGTGDLTFDTVMDHKISVQGNNSYVGSTTIQRGWISLENPNGQTALLGDITVGVTDTARLVWTAGNQISDTANITLGVNGSYLDLAGFPETIASLTMPAGTKVKTGLGVDALLRVNTLTLDGTTYNSGAFGSGTPGGFVEGGGYILVGGTPPPIVTDPPTAPSSPMPADAATGLSPFNVVLSWGDSLRATSYDIYFWPASATKPATPTAALTVANYPAPSPLTDYANYKWQVVAKNSAGSTPSPEWTFTTTSRTNISDTLGPLQDGGINIDVIVGATNSGRLVGDVITYWASQGFTVPLDLNGHTLEVNSGGGNVPFLANGAISGTGSLIFDTVWNQPINIQGTNANTYSGSTLVRRGYISLEKPDGMDALLGTITVGGTEAGRLVWTAGNQINDSADMILVQNPGFADNSQLQMWGWNETFRSLTMDAGTLVDTGGGSVLTVSSLTVGGVSQPPGSYDASTAATSGYIIGAGSIVVVPVSQPPDFPLSGFTMPGGVPTFAIPNTISGKQYTLEYKNTLGDASWTALTGAGSLPGTGGTITLKDETQPQPARRFYRLEMH